MKLAIPLALWFVSSVCGAKPPSILLVTMDTTRADRLGAYGHAKAKTPTLDMLAREGTRFTRAYTSCPLTIPAHATILTGQPPPVTGVRDNGDFLLPPEAQTLAEWLSEAGWSTAAFTAAFPTQARWGFGQGFDIYHDPLTRLPAQLDWRDQRRADEVISDAIQTLTPIDGPVFAWVHLFDPHWPYDPPEPFGTEFATRPYDGEIAFMDHHIGRLIEWWDTHHPNALVVVTADHGEGLGEGGEQTHGFLLHDGTIRVPMILRGAGIEADKVVDLPVGHVDIVPTILGIVGLTVPQELPGVDLRWGTPDSVYSEALTGMYALGIAPLVANTDLHGRYTMGTWGAWYPADGDVIETEPILGGPMVDFAEASLTQILDTLPDHRSTPAQLSDEEMRQLTALGYVGGAGIEVSAQVDPRDVMHVIPLTWQVERLLTRNDTEQANHLLQQLEKHLGKSHGVRHLRARLLRAEGRPFAAIAVLETLFQEAPSTDRALLLGRLNADIADWREAEFWFGESLALHPANAKAMSGLVRSARNQGAIGVARQRAERFLAMYPDHLDLLMIRGELLLMDRRFDEALEVAQLSVTLAPHHAGVQAQWGQALWNLGRSDEAIDAFWESLAIDPNHLGNRLQYIDALLDMERNAEAMRALRQVADHLAGVPALESRLNRCQLALERTP